MCSLPAKRTPVVEKFSIGLFLTTVTLSLAGLTGLLWAFAPQAVWQAQLNAAWWQFAVIFLGVKLFNCGMEFFFHRYVLHKPVVPFLSRFYRQHTLHHNLTRIARRQLPGGREVPYVENIYPMTEPEQGEAAFFPWYTLAVFAAIVTPLLALGQWLAPTFPWFFAGYAALAASLTLYEVFHAIEHWPLEKWAPRLESKRWGKFWTKVYSFHLRHHAVIDCNEAISGFFTFPVFDLLFGTWVSPKTLYADGGEWDPAEFKSPRPHAFIRWCDRTADKLVAKRRSRVRTKVAVRKPRRHAETALKK
jgi:hemolysin III